MVVRAIFVEAVNAGTGVLVTVTHANATTAIVREAVLTPPTIGSVINMGNIVFKRAKHGGETTNAIKHTLGSKTNSALALLAHRLNVVLPRTGAMELNAIQSQKSL